MEYLQSIFKDLKAMVVAAPFVFSAGQTKGSVMVDVSPSPKQ